MKQLSVFLAATGLGLGVLFAPSQAHALGPIDLEVGAKVGGGSNPISGPKSADGVSEPNPIGFGIGARGGISFFGLYAGVSGMYYLGSSASAAVDGVTAKSSIHTAVYGGEFGYNIKLIPLLTIRPQIGIGNAEFSESVSVGGVSQSAPSTGYLYLEPGVVALISLGILYVGADVNALLLPSGPTSNSCATPNKNGICTGFDGAITAHAQVGVKF